MHTELKINRVNPESLLRSYVERRLYFALSRFGSRVGKVTVTIVPDCSARTSDLICRAVADLHPFGAVIAEASDTDVYAAIDRAVARLVRRCQSKCTRQRSGMGRRTSIRIPKDRLAA